MSARPVRLRWLVAGSLVVPAGGGSGHPLLVLLHGRASGADQFLGDPDVPGAQGSGTTGAGDPDPSGGDHSYWHDRADGPWGTYVVREAIPAIGGVSMGGFGALDIARLHPEFCAMGASAAAVWPTAGQTVSGAFDDPTDFARHDVMGAAAHGNPYGQAAVLVDVGRTDGFRFNDQRVADDLRARGANVTFRFQPGGHSGWRGRMDQYLRFTRAPSHTAERAQCAHERVSAQADTRRARHPRLPGRCE